MVAAVPAGGRDLQPGQHLHQADPEIITLPITAVTPGLFLVVINACAAADRLDQRPGLDLGFIVPDFWAALLGSIVISIVGWALSLIVGTITPGAD